MDSTPQARTPAGTRSRTVGWSLHIGTVLGIPVRIHFTFLLLLVWFGFASWSRGGSFFGEILFILLVFGSVVLHELGHAAMALRYGVPTREIVLYPIGGVARLERIPTGRAELFIALAGPAVNVVIAGVLLALIIAAGVAVPQDPSEITFGGGLLLRLLGANVFLFVFNLIPAFPMDGGRVLRAALSLRMHDDRATSIAASVGQTIAILFGLAGFFGVPGLLPPNPILILIALFVFLGAGQEAAFFQRRALVLGRTAREAMITRFEALAPHDSLGRAAELLLATHQQDFPVIDAWSRVAGVLSRSALLRGLARHGREAAVLEVMDRDLQTSPPDADLDAVLQRLQSNPVCPILILEGERLAGMITLENLAEFVEVAKSLREPGDAAPFSAASRPASGPESPDP